MSIVKFFFRNKYNVPLIRDGHSFQVLFFTFTHKNLICLFYIDIVCLIIWLSLDFTMWKTHLKPKITWKLMEPQCELLHKTCGVNKWRIFNLFDTFRAMTCNYKLLSRNCAESNSLARFCYTCITNILFQWVA